MNLLNDLSKGKYCLPGKIKVFIFPIPRHIQLYPPFSAATWKYRVKREKLSALLTFIFGGFEFFLLLYVEFHIHNFRLCDLKK